LYEENVIPRRDPGGREYFWIGGRLIDGGERDGTDAHAVEQGYVSITPLALEATHHAQLELAQQTAGE
jgi:5'-nucleotidase